MLIHNYEDLTNLIFLSILVNAELHATEKFGRMSISTDENEHSIEMHLPYIAKVMERYYTKNFKQPLIIQ